MKVNHPNPNFNLPLFQWANDNQHKPPSGRAFYLSRKHGISIIRAAFYAEQMELEAANENH